MWIVDYWNHIDWGETGAMLSGLGTVGGAVAILLAAKMGFAAWRRQKLAERMRDQAEAVLHAAYAARRELRYLRSGWMTGGELVAAEERLNADNPDWRVHVIEEKQKRTITAQAYFLRGESSREVRTGLRETLPMARALFGEALEKAIESLDHQFHVVLVYAESYVDDYNGNDPEFTKQIKHALFMRNKRVEGQPDEVSDATTSAIETIEQTCLRYLRLEAA
jgi:hypothetical protein